MADSILRPCATCGGTERYELLCEACNLSKHARDPMEFMQSRGYLLEARPRIPGTGMEGIETPTPADNLQGEIT